MMIHTLDENYAIKYGVNAAILFDYISKCIAWGQPDDVREHDGRTWTRCGYKELAKMLPYLSEKQIRAAMKKLTAAGELSRMTFCTEGGVYDPTLWYAHGTAK